MTFGGNLAQWSVVPAVSVGGVTPDLPLVVTVFLAVRKGPVTGCVAGFVAGLLQDMAGGGLIGIQALTKALAGFCMGLLVFFHFPASLGDMMVHVILPQALYNGFLGSACVLCMAAATSIRGRTWT